MKKWITKRALPVLLSIVVIMSTGGIPVQAVSGTENTGQGNILCEHHTAHTDDCGYQEETPGTPCGHEHTEDCYIEVTECVHEHTPECYPAETEDSVSDNEATPADAKEREPENCPHICNGESGCITEKLDCRHEHDSECGYTESTPGTPCTFVCEICNPQDSGEAGKEPETGIVKQEHCSCLTLCTEGQINPDCPVCGTEDADLSDCKGKVSEENTGEQEDAGICKHHQEHDADCGYIPKSEDGEGRPCTYECRICPIEALIAALPEQVTEDNAAIVRGQLDHILDLYRELTEDEQEEIKLSRIYALQGALDAANAPMTADGHTEQQDTDKASVTIGAETLYYATLEEAFAAANGKTATITMLNDAECVHSGSNGSPLNITGGNVTLNLNGKTLSGKGYGTYGIINVRGGSLLVQGEEGKVRVTRTGLSCRESGKLTVEGITLELVGDASAGVDNEGGTVILNGTQMTGAASDGHIYQYSGTTTVNNVTATGITENWPKSVWYDSEGTLKINGGTFDKITVNSNNYGGVTSVAGLLGEGCAYKKQGGTWATDDELAGLEISNVTVEKIPLTTNPNGDTSWYYSTQQTHTLAMNAAPVDSGNSVSYAWKNGSETLDCTSDAYTVPAGTPVGSYTYICEATCDGYTLSHTFTFKIEKSGTEFTGGVKTYKDGAECSDFTAGDTITVKATPTATGAAPSNSAMFAASFTEPGAGQMAVFVNDTQVSEPVNAVDGTYTMTVSASDVLLAANGPGTEIPLTAKFVGNDNMAGAEGTVKVSITAAAKAEKDGAVIGYYGESNLADAFADVNSGATVTLLDNVELPSYIGINGGQFALNLNEHTISCNESNVIALNTGGLTICGNGGVTSGVNAVVVHSGTTLTLEGGNFSSSHAQGVGVQVLTGGVLNVTGAGVKISNLYAQDNTTVSLTAGIYESIGVNSSEPLAGLLGTDKHYAYYRADGTPVLLSELEGKTELTGPVTVQACQHTGVEATNNNDGTHSVNCPYCGYTSENEPHNFNETGYCPACKLQAAAKVEKDGSATAYVEASGLNAAFKDESNSGATITLLDNITTSTLINVITDNLTLDLNGKTYTCTDAAFFVYSSSLTIKGSGAITSSGFNCLNVYGGTLNIESGSFSGEESAVFVRSGGALQLTGGSFTGGKNAIKYASGDVKDALKNYGGTDAPHYAFYQDSSPYAPLGSSLPSGTFTVGTCKHDGVKPTSNSDGTHALKCPYCGYSEAAANCTYVFSGTTGTCAACGDSVTVAVSGAENLIYDGTEKKPGVTVTRAGTELATSNYMVAYTDNTNAGTAKVTVTIGNSQGTYTGNFNIAKASLTIKANDQTITYGGSITQGTGQVTSEGLCGGDTLESVTLTPSSDQVAVADKTITPSGAKIQNSSGTDVTRNYKITYETGTLTITKAEGTLTVSEASIEKTFGDAEFSLNCTTNGDGKISYTSSNKGVATVSADGNVLIKGAGEATITVSLAEGTNHTGGAEAMVTVTVEKAAAPAVIGETKNYTYTNGSNGAVTIDVAGKLPNDRGETKYTFTTTDEKGILSGVSIDGNGNLRYTVLGNRSEGDTASITVTAEMANYENAAYTVSIELVKKKVVEPQAGSSVSVKGSSILTYGQTLSDLTLDSVIFVEQGTNTEVEGALTWKDGSVVPAVGTAAAEWTFTPTDAAEYAELTGMVAITVVKATPEVEAPEAETVTYHPSRTLDAAKLTGGSATWTVSGSAVTVEGTWSWKDASVVPAVGNSGYTVVFTPKGTANYNYNTVECTVAVTVEKAVPHIAVPPTAAQITFGDALEASALTGGTAQYSSSDGTVVAGSFAWKDGAIRPAVSDSGSTGYAVVFLPADRVNYSSVETVVTLTIEQAENAPRMPPESMKVARRYEKIGSVPLPEGWQWQETDRDTALEIGVPVTATAVYNGEDRENYKNVSVAVAVTRLDCDHERTELRGAAAATCQKKGYSGDTYCLECGELLEKGTETGLADHSGGTATCVSGKVCTVCGTEYGAKDSASHAHKEIRGQRDAACTADGYTGDEFCTDCGAKTGSGAVIAATGHDWHVTKEEPATTSSEGKRYYACSKCGQTREEAIPKLPGSSHTHSYSARETKAATCTENGVITYSCSCGDSYTQNTAALGHDYRSRVTKEPTRTEEGVKTYTCTRCQSAYTEGIPKLPEETHTHSYIGRVTKKATCTETGIRTYACACGDRYTKTIPAPGHSYTHKVTKEPTTEKNGVRTYTCSRCGNTYTEGIPKLPAKDHKHDYSNMVVKEASCTEAGVRRFACACGDSYTESIPASGHSYHSRVAQEPTVSAEGVMAYTCSRCGDTYTKPINRLEDTSSEPWSRPESGSPFIKDEPDRDGWETIKEETDRAGDGSTVTVDMNGSAIVPGGVLENIRGRDITIIFDMGDGITWSVDGKSVKDGEVSDIDFSVRTDTEEIPEDKVDSIAGEKYSIQISLAHEGEFGFTAVLSLDLGKENAGLYARLFYYNESTGELETAARAEKIAGDGRVSLAFTHASEYVIVVDVGEGNPTEEGAEDVSSKAPAEPAGTDTTDKSPQTGQPWRPWWIIMVGALVIVIGMGVFCVARRKKESSH